MLERLNNRNTLIIIGRAHSGTRILPEAMKAAGIFMGNPQNIASDLLPVDDIYECCRIFGPYVSYKGDFRWDFSKALTEEIPDKFLRLLTRYLRSLIESDHPKKGWKIPNNTLIYPWLTRILPQASFIHWVRHPESSCAKMTGVDRLEKWNIPTKKFLFHEFNYKIRAASWKYHCDIVMETPKPQNFLQIRYEDYVIRQDKTKEKVEDFIDHELPSLVLNPNKAGPYSKKYLRFAFLRDRLSELSYL